MQYRSFERQVSPTSTQPIFPRLSSGPRKMEAEAVARHQRGRLQGAMVEAVARRGFGETTLRELVSLAGVSKSTFYEHFKDKQDCFMATFDDVILEIDRRVGDAFDEPGDLRTKLLAGVGAVMDVVAEEQAAASLVVVDSLTLGAAAVAHRERAAELFERQISELFDRSPSPRAKLAPLTVRGIVSGIRNCIYRHLRAGNGDELPGVAGSIVDWMLCFDRPLGETPRRAAAAAARPSQIPARAAEDGHEPSSKRERIVCAATQLGFEKGYEALSIPAISAAAGISNQTFYDHFPGKREAFLAGFNRLAEETMAVVAQAAATESAPPEVIGAGLRALLEHIAEEDLFARLAFFELPMAGPAALDQADRILGGFTTFFSANAEGDAVPEVIMEAIGGGAWAVIQHEIAAGRRAGLPQRAPEIVEFAVAPF
jgi:AcrR family transcriptional regulator